MNPLSAFRYQRRHKRSALLLLSLVALATLSVIAVSTGLVVWMLYRLDPVSVIERR